MSCIKEICRTNATTIYLTFSHNLELVMTTKQSLNLICDHLTITKVEAYMINIQIALSVMVTHAHITRVLLGCNESSSF